MGKKRKIISLIVSVAMLVAMFPMIVHADGEPTPGSFAALQAQLEANGSSLVELSEDCAALSTESSIVVPAGETWNLNLNGKMIRGNGSDRIFVVEAGATLRLMNFTFYSDTPATSMIVSGKAANGGAVYVEEGGNLLLNPGISFAGNGAQNGGAIYCKGTVDISNDVTINGNFTTDGNGSDIFVAEGGTLILGGDASIGNVYLSKDTVISVTGPCTNSRVGVETEVVPTASKPVTFAVETNDNIDYGSTDIFTCSSEYEIVKEGKEYLLKGEGEVVVTPPSLEYCNMTLDGKIGLNVYILPGTYSVNDLSGCYMEFNVGSREPQTVEFDSSFTTTINNQTVYGFRCNLSSVEMGCNVLCMLKNEEGTIAQGGFSISSYLATVSPQPNGVEKAFVNFAHFIWAYMKSIHTEGEYAWENEYPQIATVYDNITDDYSTDYSAVIAKCETDGIKAATKDIADSDVNKVTFQLEFETTNAFMIYFYLKTDSTYSANSIPVTVNGEKKRAYKVADKKYRIRINDIYLQDLETEYEIKSDCADVGDFTVTASPMSYVYTALCNNSSSTVKKDAMVSVYWLWKMASAYNAN